MNAIATRRTKFLIILFCSIGLVLGLYLFIDRSSVASEPQPRTQAKVDDVASHRAEQLPVVDNSLPLAADPAPAAPSLSNHPANSAAQDFRRSNTCVSSMREIASMSSQMGICSSIAEIADNDAKQFCERKRAEVQARMGAEESNLSSCVTQDPLTEEERYFENTVRAAALGDVDAQLCYVNANFKLQRPFTAEENKAYYDSARKYIDAAISRGDWRIVEILRSAGPGVAQAESLLFQVTAGDQVTVYKMNRLLKLGAEGRYAQTLDNLNEVPVHPYGPSDVEEADEWARRTYESNFRKSPRLREAPMRCLRGR
ncbi:hypothetical protein V3391_07615 [Luteimonas sp. SMYT11W]|uniref:Sel1 repeat family protein n=1 Tax=Luteimonas flava TaxID=3115822 RepID=A0ABU7WDQ7_9GAMM